MTLCETISFIDPDDVEFVLTAAVDHEVIEGITGRGMPPIRISDEVVPLQPGGRVRLVEHDVREVAVPLVFFDTSLEMVRAALRGIMRTFDPTRGEGRLRVATPDGIERELRCRYVGGFEVAETPGDRGISPYQSAQKAILVFRAFDPYWYDVDPYEASFAVTPGGTFLPIPNVTTGSFVTIVASEVFTSGVIDLSSDVDAQSWPIWTITGPASAIVITNDTTGEMLDFSAAGGLVLLSGEVATIDTRPGIKTALLDDLTNLYPYLTSGSSLFPLGPTQTISIDVVGASIDTQVALTVYAAHLSV